MSTVNNRTNKTTLTIMKKYLFGAFMLLIGSTSLTSCLNDEDDEHAEATVPYFAICDSIIFTDLNDTVYSAMLLQSLNKLKIVGEGSIFEESAKVNVGIPAEAINLCDQQAIKTYERTLSSISLADIKDNIYITNKNEQGWTSENEVALDAFTATITLHGIHTSNRVTIKVFTHKF